MEQISKNITYAEAIHSNTAKRRCIDNTPTAKQVEVMKLTAEKVFEPLREWVGGPKKVIHFSVQLHLMRQLVDQHLASTVKDKQLILTMFMVVKQMQKCMRG